MALYGAQKVAKTTLALGKPKLLTGVHHSYNIGLLRCFPAFSLFVSFIRDQRPCQIPHAARPVACLRTGSIGHCDERVSNILTIFTI